MATTWDWSPLVQAFGGIMQQAQQKQQYEQLLQSLLGPDGATTPQPQPAQGLIGRLLNPQARQQPQQSPMAAQAAPMQMGNPEDIQASSDQMQPQNMVGMRALPQTAQGGGFKEILQRLMGGIGAQGGGQRYPMDERGSINSPQAGGGSPLGGIDPRMADLFRRLPPQIGMPLLLQTMQSQMTPTKPVEVAAGGHLVDPRTGREIYGAPEKAEPFSLSEGQTRFDAQGHPLASVDKPKTRLLTPEETTKTGFPQGSIVTEKPDGSFSVEYKPPEAAPYRPLTKQELNDKVTLAGAETRARTQAQAPDAGDENVEAQAQAIANYQQAPMSGFALARPFGQAVQSRVMQINPQWQAQNFTKSNQAYKSFGTGKQGDLVRSFNVGISHLNTLGTLTEALGNGDTQAINALKNTFREQFGSTAPTNFDAAKAIVGDEIIKAIVGGGGALADRENAQNQLKRASSPAQLKGIIDTYKHLMAGQLGGLKKQYEGATMRKDFNDMLLPETQAELEGAGGAPGGGTLPTIANPADARKLPSGTHFKTPDGRELVVP